MESHIEKGFGWRRNLDYIKVNFIIMYKRLLEYKSNFWSSFSIEMIYFVMMTFFFKIILNTLDYSILWTFEDFFLYMLFSAQIFAVVGIFAWKGYFGNDLVRGLLNLYILRPMNTWFLFYFNRLDPAALVFIIIDTIFIIGTFYYYSLIIHNFILSLLVYFLICSLIFLIFVFISSIDFFILKFSESYGDLVFRVYNMFEMYPAVYFKNVSFYFFMLFLPGFMIGSLLLPLIRGYEIWNLELQLMLLISLNLFFGLLIFINWHYGLKKYEAFG